MTMIHFAYSVLITALGVAAAACTAYLLMLLLAAVVSEWERKRRPAIADTQATLPKITVVIPAHNEEIVLNATLQSLKTQTYPSGRYEVVVIADNCTDTTAALARPHCSRVMKRTNERERGKGYALNWAFAQLLSETGGADAFVDAFVVIDADTWVDPDFLRVMAQALTTRQDSKGRVALQGRYGVDNQDEGWRPALMTGALDLFNHVRPLGSDRLGLNVGLKGNGMAFSRKLLEQAPWQGSSVTEDIDYGLDLLLYHRVRVGYVPDAQVMAQMPISAKQAATQRERWEFGRYRLLRERALPLFSAGLLRRDLRLCDAAFGLILPPLAELAALMAVWGCAIAVGYREQWLRDTIGWAMSFGLTATALILYVLGGLRAAGASSDVYRALVKAPAYAGWKLALYAAAMFRKLTSRESGPQEWLRTARTPIAAAEPAYAVVRVEER